MARAHLRSAARMNSLVKGGAGIIIVFIASLWYSVFRLIFSYRSSNMLLHFSSLFSVDTLFEFTVKNVNVIRIVFSSIGLV